MRRLKRHQRSSSRSTLTETDDDIFPDGDFQPMRTLTTKFPVGTPVEVSKGLQDMFDYRGFDRRGIVLKVIEKPGMPPKVRVNFVADFEVGDLIPVYDRDRVTFQVSRSPSPEPYFGKDSTSYEWSHPYESVSKRSFIPPAKGRKRQQRTASPEIVPRRLKPAARGRRHKRASPIRRTASRHVFRHAENVSRSPSPPYFGEDSTSYERSYPYESVSKRGFKPPAKGRKRQQRTASPEIVPRQQLKPAARGRRHKRASPIRRTASRDPAGFVSRQSSKSPARGRRRKASPGPDIHRASRANVLRHAENISEEQILASFFHGAEDALPDTSGWDGEYESIDEGNMESFTIADGILTERSSGMCGELEDITDSSFTVEIYDQEKDERYRMSGIYHNPVPEFKLVFQKREEGIFFKRQNQKYRILDDLPPPSWSCWLRLTRVTRRCEYDELLARQIEGYPNPDLMIEDAITARKIFYEDKRAALNRIVNNPELNIAIPNLDDPQDLSEWERSRIVSYGADLRIYPVAAPTSLELNGEQCGICLECFTDNDLIRRVPCLHAFHSDCIGQWCRNHTTCPLCKLEL